MKSLCNKSNIICKITKIFLKIFSNETKPTQEHLIDLLLSDFQLKSYYNTLKKGRLDLQEWLLSVVEIAISLIPKVLESKGIILSVDDTIIAKQGKRFEDYSVLFDYPPQRFTIYNQSFLSYQI